MAVNWKKIGRVGARVAGAGLGLGVDILTGGAATPFFNPLTGYELGAQASDAALKDDPITSQKTEISGFNQMDAYTPGAKGRAKSTYEYQQEPNQGFNKGMGILDTGVQLAGLIAPASIGSKISGEGTNTSKGWNSILGVGKTGSPSTIGSMTENINKDFMGKNNSLFDGAKAMKDIYSMLNTNYPGQFGNLKKKISNTTDLTPYKIPTPMVAADN